MSTEIKCDITGKPCQFGGNCAQGRLTIERHFPFIKRSIICPHAQDRFEHCLTLLNSDNRGFRKIQSKINVSGSKKATLVGIRPSCYVGMLKMSPKPHYKRRWLDKREVPLATIESGSFDNVGVIEVLKKRSSVILIERPKNKKEHSNASV